MLAIQIGDTQVELSHMIILQHTLYLTYSHQSALTPPVSVGIP